LDKVLQALSNQKEEARVLFKNSISSSGRLHIILKSSVIINRSGLIPPIVDFLKEHLIFSMPIMRLKQILEEVLGKRSGISNLSMKPITPLKFREGL
jgi:hypothetical protein